MTEFKRNGEVYRSLASHLTEAGIGDAIEVATRESFGRPKRYEARYWIAAGDPFFDFVTNDPVEAIDLGVHPNATAALTAARSIRPESDPDWIYAHWPEVDRWEQAWPIR